MLAGFPPLMDAAKGNWYFDRIRKRQWAHFWAQHERANSFSRSGKDMLESMLAAEVFDGIPMHVASVALYAT